MFYGNPCGPCADRVTSPIIHPPKYCNVNTFSSTLVPHVHPTHTTVVNHHVNKHTHLFPHSTSFANTVNNVDIGPAAGITPAYGGYGGGYGVSGGYSGGMAPYSGMMPQMPTSASEAYNENIINVKVTPPAYPAQVAPPTYPTQVAPVPGVKEMPMYPGMKRNRRY